MLRRLSLSLPTQSQGLSPSLYIYGFFSRLLDFLHGGPVLPKEQNSSEVLKPGLAEYHFCHILWVREQVTDPDPVQGEGKHGSLGTTNVSNDRTCLNEEDGTWTQFFKSKFWWIFFLLHCPSLLLFLPLNSVLSSASFSPFFFGDLIPFQEFSSSLPWDKHHALSLWFLLFPGLLDWEVQLVLQAERAQDRIHFLPSTLADLQCSLCLILELAPPDHPGLKSRNKYLWHGPLPPPTPNQGPNALHLTFSSPFSPYLSHYSHSIPKLQKSLPRLF